MASVTITINDKPYTAEEGAQLLGVLRDFGFTIPALCYHPDFEPEENCRLCLVRINGKVTTSCNALVKSGMKIDTDTQELRDLRRTNAELLIANYNGPDADFQKTLLATIARETGAKRTTFAPRKTGRKELRFNDILSYDLTTCVDCKNCVRACAGQSVCAVQMEKYGYKEEIAKRGNRYCVYCGQCMAHCPSGSITANRSMYRTVSKFLTQTDDRPVMVAQIAPAVRASIGEAFGIQPGSVMTGKLVSALKKIGFDYVFDTAVSADLTTMEEAKELVRRLQTKQNLPMFTSCCPGWVRYLGVYYPKLLPYLTSVHSPQIMMGGIIKWYWAKKMNIPKERIHVVSIMPCLAKKWESSRKEFAIDGISRVDSVLTTVETASLLKERGVTDMMSLPDTPMDDPLGRASGSGVIFGASGGVMVSALRTGYYLLTGKNPTGMAFEKITALDGYKTMNVTAPGLTLRVAAIDGLGNVPKIIPHLSDFDYIEVMACRGGCIGGGGQPTPVNDEIRKIRARALFDIDSHDTLRFAHDNPAIDMIYKEFLTDEHMIHTFCHYLPEHG